MSKIKLNEERIGDKLWPEEEETIDKVRKGKSKFEYYENSYKLLDELKKIQNPSTKT